MMDRRRGRLRSWGPFLVFLIVSAWAARSLADSWPAVDRILADAGVQRGNCLLVGFGSSSLGVELRRCSELRIYAVEPDQASVAIGRDQVDQAGLYGKVTVHGGDWGDLHFPPLHFHLIVFDLGGKDPAEAPLATMYRLLRPGGKALLTVGSARSAGWRELMESLGLETENVRDLPEGGGLLYTRPGPDPDRNWRSWFANAFHHCACDSPGFHPPLVEVWSWRCVPSARHNWVVPIVGDGAVVYHEWQFGYINAHDAYTGQLLWSHGSQFPDNAGVHKRLWMSVPAVAGGTTLVATSLEELTCIDLQTGQTLWTKPIPEDIDWDQVPGAQSLRHVAVHDGKYYLLVNKERAVYYDPRTGDETQTDPLLPYRAYCKVDRYVFYPEFWNYSHRPMTWTVAEETSGEKLYTFRSSGRPRFCIAEPERLILCQGWDGYSAVDLDTGERRWIGPAMTYSCGSATYAGGYAWRTASGATYCIDVHTGEIPWLIRSSNSCVPPTIANGMLYTMSNNSLRLRAFTSADLLALPAKRSP